jgi:hypothetical protein
MHRVLARYKVLTKVAHSTPACTVKTNPDGWDLRRDCVSLRRPTLPCYYDCSSQKIQPPRSAGA